MTIKELNVINETTDKYGHIAGEYEGEKCFLCYGICSTIGFQMTKQNNKLIRA